jgi:thiosulfate/3-mercaptopyruvate sulfurtransferase
MTRFTFPAAIAVLALAGPVQAGDMRVSPQWLSAHLNDADLVILHVGDEGRYKARHIPGARRVDLDDISVKASGLTLQVPQPADLKTRLEKLGISANSRIVVYYDQDWISPATRVVFTLHAAGLGERTSLLDGGLAHWKGEVTRAVPAAKTGRLPDLRLLPVVADHAFVKAHLSAPGYDIIDARAAMFYDGLHPGGPMGHAKKGHIPGAKSLPFTAINNDDLTLKTPTEFRTLFAQAGVKPGDRVIAYCHIGQQATAILFAAREADIDAVLYDGSFEDWAIRNAPVEE